MTWCVRMSFCVFVCFLVCCVVFLSFRWPRLSMWFASMGVCVSLTQSGFWKCCVCICGSAAIGLRGAWFAMVCAFLQFCALVLLFSCSCCVRICRGVLRVSVDVCVPIYLVWHVSRICVYRTTILSFFGCAIVCGHKFSVLFLFAVVAGIVGRWSCLVSRCSKTVSSGKNEVASDHLTKPVAKVWEILKFPKM